MPVLTAWFLVRTMSGLDSNTTPVDSGEIARALLPCERQRLDQLSGWFSAPYLAFDGDSGELLLRPAELKAAAVGNYGSMCRAVVERGEAEWLDAEEPLAAVAIPLTQSGRRTLVAVGIFALNVALTPQLIARAAERLGLSLADAKDWFAGRMRWAPDTLLAMAQIATERMAAEGRLETLEGEVREVSLQLSTTYEEVSLLYRLTQHLKLSSDDESLGKLAIGWLADVVPAESLALLLTPAERCTTVPRGARTEPLMLTEGPCPIAADELARIVEHFGLRPGGRPLIVNPPLTNRADWPFPGIRQMVLVALSDGQNGFGWLAAFNHSDGGHFGTVEASLLSSVGVILGIHSGNAELYHQQRESFAGMVRALTSAIDAKDPHTCGHSDRVARVAVRLAEQLGIDGAQMETVYLSGLLHDVGKIGVSDQVLRKEGELTPSEYEHIKTHTEIGYRILADLHQLDDVLPVVLHHHEQWDGSGYPTGLCGYQIPLLARIVAVADAFDAMSSDRPYRQGLSEEMIEQVLRDGAGRQWDADVVSAFFAIREQLREIVREPSTMPAIESYRAAVQGW